MYEYIAQTASNSGTIGLVGTAGLTGAAAVWLLKRRTQQAKTGAGKSLLQPDIILQSISDGIIVIDTNGLISVMNPAAAALTEWQPDEATGLDVHAVIKLAKEDGKDIEPAKDPFAVVFSQKARLSQTVQLTSRDKKTLIVSMVISPVSDPTTKEIAGAIAVFRDVSQQRIEEQRRAEFISTASHEMRTPVAAIEGYLALALNENVSKVDVKARSYLEKAHTSTQHLGKLFQDLLTSAKAEDGRLSSHPVAVEMGAYLEQLVDDLRFAAQKKGLLMEFVIGSSEANNGANKVVRPLYHVFADPDRLREVVTNLFDNAVKYTESGKVSIGITGNAEVVQLYIKDTGPGIPAEDVPHLFQKFYRVDNSATRTIGGTGLGLFICRKIIELYHGRIWVESEVGKGSCFFINLPRLSQQKATELQTAEAAQSSPAPITSLTAS